MTRVAGRFETAAYEEGEDVVGAELCGRGEGEEGVAEEEVEDGAGLSLAQSEEENWRECVY